MTVAADDIKNDNTSTTPTVDDSIENNGPSKKKKSFEITFKNCLLYTSDAADDLLTV